MNTLLHICCAPCANQCIDVLRADHYDVTGFWYNPNIHPFTEYRARRNCLREYAQTIELPLIERNDYGLRPFVRAVADDIENRCVKCYEFRLYEAARQAKEGGFDSFTSSLFISPYQKHELMREVAQRPPANTAWNSSTGTSGPISGQARNGPESWASTFRNTAAASSPRKSGT